MEICEHSENEFILREGYAVDTYNGSDVYGPLQPHGYRFFVYKGV